MYLRMKLGLAAKSFFLLSLPTLFISECVLIYLAPEESQSILDWITANVQHSMFLLYEQILPDDTFGKVMLRNLKVNTNGNFESEKNWFFSIKLAKH